MSVEQELREHTGCGVLRWTFAQPAPASEILAATVAPNPSNAPTDIVYIYTYTCIYASIYIYIYVCHELYPLCPSTSCLNRCSKPIKCTYRYYLYIYIYMNASIYIHMYIYMSRTLSSQYHDLLLQPML